VSGNPVNFFDPLGLKECSCSSVNGAPSSGHLKGHSSSSITTTPLTQSNANIINQNNTEIGQTFDELSFASAGAAIYYPPMAVVATGFGVLSYGMSHATFVLPGDYIKSSTWSDSSTGGYHNRTSGVSHGKPFVSPWQNNCSEG